jgi:DNA-binding NtrC family response regulator
MRTLKHRLDGCDGTLEGVFNAFLPGTSPAVAALRQDAVALCRDPGARGALILGPPGAGKSTLARVIGFGRYVHGLNHDAAERVIKKLSIEPPARINRLSMDWYEEISLTGLVETLADSQLFGCVAGAGTGVMARKGVFRQAMLGHQDQDARITVGAKLTGGVVFLDEIGDLPGTLQPKLLTVLTGAEISPVGAEGNQDQAYRYAGLTLAATWKDPSAVLRHDLVSRLTDHALTVPSIGERLEDFDIIVDAIVSEIVGAHEAWFEDRKTVVDVDRDRLARHVKRVRETVISDSDRAELRRADWNRYADMRGLSQTIRRMLDQGLSAEESLARQMQLPTRPAAGEVSDDAMIGQLMTLASAGRDTTLSALVAEWEKMTRSRAFDALKGRPLALGELASRLGVTVSELRESMASLGRPSRRRDRG